LLLFLMRMRDYDAMFFSLSPSLEDFERSSFWLIQRHSARVIEIRAFVKQKESRPGIFFDFSTFVKQKSHLFFEFLLGRNQAMPAMLDRVGRPSSTIVEIRSRMLVLKMDT